LPVAEIGQQQQAAIEIGGQHLGRVQAQLAQGAGDGDKGPAVLLIRRRVHDDAGLAVVPNSKITAETGVAGRRRDALRRGWQHGGQPVQQKILSVVHKKRLRPGVIAATLNLCDVKNFQQR